MKRIVMTKHDLLAHVLERFGTVPDYPWVKHPTYAVLRHTHHRKWYAVIMTLPGSTLGLTSTDEVTVVNVKVNPAHIGGLLAMPSILPAYHMNKEHWVSVRLDSADNSTLFELIEDSAALTA